MQTKVSYEWSIETVDEHGDIVDSSFYDEKPEIPLDTDERLVLIRSEGNERDGVTDRLWAYLKDGKLPEFFEDELGEPTRIKIPKKFLCHN